jgi:lycopene cyclase domain-containing protein
VSYTAAAVLGVLGALAVDLLVLRTRLVLRRLWWVSYGIVVFFQLITNGVLTGRRIVRYDESAISGVRIVYAPAEDLLFGFAMVLLTISIWVWLGRRGVEYSPVSGEPRPGPESAQ